VVDDDDELFSDELTRADAAASAGVARVVGDEG
jgi:hypothetical protein